MPFSSSSGTFPFMASSRPPRPARWPAIRTNSASEPSARATTVSKDFFGFSASARPWITSTFGRRSIVQACLRKVTFLPVDSMRLYRRSRSAIASGRPGKPAPEPTSATVSPFRCGRTASESSKCLSTASAGSLIAVRLKRGFQAASSATSVSSASTWAGASSRPSPEIPAASRDSIPAATSGDLDDRASLDLVLDETVEGGRQLVEGDRPRDELVEMLRLQVRREPLPDMQADVAWHRRRVDAEQAHAAQDERHHRRLELVARSEADAHDVAPVVDRAREPGEDLAADVVDRAAPERGFERALAEVDLLAAQEARSAERLEVRVGLGLAAHRDDLEAARREDVDRDRPDPP